MFYIIDKKNNNINFNFNLMEINEIKEIQLKDSKNIIDDKTFNKIKNIQSLLKKESALNELCN